MKKLFLIILLSLNLFAMSEKEELLRLNLDALLYTKDLKDALKLAKSVADERGDDVFWIEKVANIAIWNNRADIAKVYFKKLYDLNHEKEVLKRLQILANQTNDEVLKISILEDKLDHGRLKYASSLYDAYELEGRLYDGALFFDKVYKKYKTKELLKYRLLLVKDYALFKEFEYEYLKFVKLYGIDEDLTLFYAKVLFANKKYEKAFLNLDKLKDNISIKRVDFWEFYIDLAYTLKKEKDLYVVLKRRFKQEKIKKEDLRKLLYLSKKIDPTFKDSVVKNYYRDYPSKSTFYLYISLLQQDNNNAQISKILKNIPKDLEKSLKQDPEYWLLKASDYKYQNKIKESVNAYKIALKLSPKNMQIQKTIIWSLIDSDLKDELKVVVKDISLKPEMQKSLSYELSSAYAVLGDHKKAKKYLKSIKIREDEWQKRIFYADILTNELDIRGAKYQLRKAFIDAKKDAIKSELFRNDNQKLFDFIRLAVKFEPLRVKRYIRIAKKRFSKEKLAELYLSQAVENDLYERAKFIAKKYNLDHPWLKLYFAKFQKDKKAIKRFLGSDLKLQKYALADAAYSVGMSKEADEFVKEALSKDKDDIALKQLYKLKQQEKKPKLQASLEYVKRSKLKYMKEGIKVDREKFRFELDQKNCMKIDMPHHNDTTLKIDFKDSDKDWYYGIRASARERFDVEYGYEFNLGYKKSSDDLKISLAKKVEDDSSNFMLLYANKDVAKLQFQHKFSQRDILDLEVYKNRYFQNDTHLGDSFGGGITYSKYLRFGYPTIMLNTFMQFQDYDLRDERLVFKDYWQVGVGALIGDNNQEKYTKYRRFYTTGNLVYNSQTEFGYSLGAGMKNILFGMDSLSIEASYSSGVGKYDEDFIHLMCKYALW